MKTIAKNGMLTAVALAGLVTSQAALAADQVATVSVVGEVALAVDDAQTEKDVKRDARRRALEQGAGVMVSSNTLVRNFQMVSDEVTTQAKGVLVDEVWGPMTKADGVAKIKLDAKVSKEAMEGAICTVIKANHNPKISLVFVEKTGDEGAPWKIERGYVEALFTAAFKDSCFTIVEPGVKVSEIAATGDLPQETIDAIVKNSKAEYVALGTAKLIKSNAANSVVGGTDMKSYSISANVKLVNVATNEIEAVASASQQILGISPENALKMKGQGSAGTKAGMVIDNVMKELLDKITARWTDIIVNASSVEIVVENVPNYAAAKAFREYMVKVFAGAKVEQRNVSGGKANFDVSVEGGADTIASTVEGKKAGKWTIEVISVNRGKLTLKLN